MAAQLDLLLARGADAIGALEVGDEVTIEIESIGALTNRVVFEGAQVG